MLLGISRRGNRFQATQIVCSSPKGGSNGGRNRWVRWRRAVMGVISCMAVFSQKGGGTAMLLVPYEITAAFGEAAQVPF